SASLALPASASSASPRACSTGLSPAIRRKRQPPSTDRPPMNEASTPIENGGSGAPSRASGSSFYTAMRILPRAQREAMFEIYSFCRMVDDIADSDAPHTERLDGLARWRLNIDALYFGRPPDDLRNLARTVREFDLRKDDFVAVIE